MPRSGIDPPGTYTGTGAARAALFFVDTIRQALARYAFRVQFRRAPAGIYRESKKMHKAHLDHKTSEQLGHAFYRVNNDRNGNPRYVIHFLAFSNDYDKAKRLAGSIGFKVYRAKQFGGGFVGQSYNLESTAEQIIKLRQWQSRAAYISKSYSLQAEAI